MQSNSRPLVRSNSRVRRSLADTRIGGRACIRRSPSAPAPCGRQGSWAPQPLVEHTRQRRSGSLRSERERSGAGETPRTLASPPRAAVAMPLSDTAAADELRLSDAALIRVPLPSGAEATGHRFGHRPRRLRSAGSRFGKRPGRRAVQRRSRGAPLSHQSGSSPCSRRYSSVRAARSTCAPPPTQNFHSSRAACLY